MVKEKEADRYRYVKKPSAVSTKIGEELVVLEINTGVYYSLNESGIQIWEILSEPASLSEIISLFGEVYDIPGDEGLDSIRNLIADLETSGLIERVPKN